MSRADLESLGVYLDKLKQKYLLPFEQELKRLESIVKGSQSAISFEDYNTMITELNTMSSEDAFVGLNILIVTLNVPDLWISEILEESSPYIYVSDDYFVEELKLNGKVQIGHFVVSPLETLKVDLTDYVKNTDYVKGTFQSSPANISAGIVKPIAFGHGGIDVSTVHAGGLRIIRALYSLIDSRTPNDYLDGGTQGQNYCCPITPANLDYAVISVLTNCKIELTDDQKAKARKLLGIE